MRSHVALLAVLLASPALGQEAALLPEPLPVTRVVLYASGVGYFEHEGVVEGDRSMQLTFNAEQINDVLKSMVLMDLDGGRVGAVTYPSREPTARALKSFGVDLGENPTLPALLNQLRGAAVTVRSPEAATGSILNVTSRMAVVGQPAAQVTEHVLNLVTPAGITAIPLDAISTFELSDAGLRDELNKALTLLAESRNTERRPVELRFEGEGKRRVRVGYLAETPVWKTSYRLDLSGTNGDDATGRGFLQGWAIVENTSESDWSSATLGLVSGQPISFAMDLYTPLYVTRPVAQLPRYESLKPRIYAEGQPMPPSEEPVAELQAQAQKLEAAGRRSGQRNGPTFSLSEAVSGPASRTNLFSDEAESVSSMATGGKMGELFQFTIDRPIDLPRRRSAMLPIVSKAVEAEKLSIYNDKVLKEHPLHGVKLTNTTGVKLLAGPVTVFDGTGGLGGYAGDALVDHVGPGEHRYLSYGVDAEVTVVPEGRGEGEVTFARIGKGVLHLTRQYVIDKVYRIHNKAAEPKAILVEHAVDEKTEVLEPAKFEERTPHHVRFRVAAAPGAVTELRVRTRQPGEQYLEIGRQSPDALLVYLKEGRITDEVKQALEKAISLKHELAALERRKGEIEAELKEIAGGQQRLRENLKSVGQDTPLGKRYLGKLGEEEDRIDRLNQELGQLRPKIDDQRRALDQYLAELHVD